MRIMCAVIAVCLLLCGCADLHEPNNIAYVVALGIDKAKNDNYDITIQFARPVQISGGSGEGSGSGENITENITIEAPTLFGALSIANQLVSKKFDMSHAKLIIFSEEVAREGISNFMEAMTRSSQVRPNIYMAVALGSAGEYLRAVKPMIEINPVKYYQLIYENSGSVYSPNDLTIDFYFSETSDYSDSVLPLAGVIAETDEGSGEGNTNSESGAGGSSGSGEQSGGGGDSKSAGSDAQPAEKKSGFQFHLPDYIPGELPKKTSNKSEVIGMALFSGDKMKGMMGATDCEIYNMIKGTYISSYVPFKNLDNDDIITMRIEEEEKPDIKVDVSDDMPKIAIKMELEGEITSVPNYFVEEENILELEQMMKRETEKAVGKFLYKTAQSYNVDICGFGGYAKRSFLTNQEFEKYKWKEKYKDAAFDVDIEFRIRRSGLVLRNSVDVK